MKIFRWKGVIPFVLISLAGYVLATFFLDQFLRNLIIKQGTKINHALVDVNSVRLSFLKSQLVIRGLAVTEPKNHMSNRFEMGKIVTDFQFLPLLQKKFIVDEISFLDFKPATPRKKPGDVPSSWQKEWTESEKKEPGILDDVWADLEKELSPKLPEIDLNALGEKFNPKSFVQLDKMKSYQTAKALPSEMTSFVNQSKQKSTQFYSNQKNHIANYKEKIGKINPKNIKSPEAAINMIQNIQSLQSEIKQHTKEIETFQKDLTSQLSEKAKSFANIDDLFKEDLNELKGKLGFGNLKLDHLSQAIFGTTVLNHYKTFLNNYSLVQKILSLREKKEERSLHHERSKGRNIYFPITNRYPTFLLSKLQFSADTRKSKQIPEKAMGTYELKAMNFTTDPKLLGRPAEVHFDAAFLKSIFQSGTADLLFDRTKVDSHDQIRLKVSKVQISGFTLGQGGPFELPIQQGISNIEATVDLKDKIISAQLRGDFANIAVDFEKSISAVHPIVKICREVLSKIHSFDLRLIVRGELRRPSFSISSSIDQALKEGVTKVLMEKIRVAQAKLEAYLQKEIGSHIASAKSTYDSYRKDALGKIDSSSKELKAIDNLLNQKLSEAKKKQKESLMGKFKF